MGYVLSVVPVAPKPAGPPSELRRKVVTELERKLSWAFGTTYGADWKRSGGIAQIARRLAWHFVTENGLPD